jgi:hypothetical protein
MAQHCLVKTTRERATFATDDPEILHKQGEPVY